VSEFLPEALALWRDCPDTLPDLGSAISPEAQAAREPLLDAFVQAIQSEARHPPRTRAERHAAHQRSSAAFAGFGRGALGFDDSHLQLLLGGGFSSIGTLMARRARAFDPAVNLADVLQASRNAWTACGLQMLFGRAMELTPSIFAYSMLYPYSDNYLDDPAVEPSAKRGFSARFGARLEGAGPAPANRHEDAIWRLVALIESQYPRSASPRVYESLLAIHGAQERSLLLRRAARGGEVDVESLCFAKGGASVLADAFLAAGEPSPAQARFAFFWGVLLQLCDDLQDLAEDLRDGALTLFSRDAGRIPLDGLTNRTLHYTRAVMAMLAGLPGEPPLALTQLIRRSSLSLIVRAASDASEFYSPEYARFLESRSPFRLAFLEERRRTMNQRSGLLVRLFEAFLAGDDDEPAFPWLPNSLLPR
jgi:hypothetical protein